MFKKILLTGLLLTFTFAINAQNWWGNSNKIKGNGNVITQTRNVSNFNAISVGGSFDVILIKGKEGKITLEGEENILPFIETETNSDNLKIQFEKNTNITTTKKLIITVYFKDIESISLGGSGKILSEEIIKGNQLKVNLGGSGKIELIIDTHSISNSIGGSGDIVLEGKTNEMQSKIAGSGSIKAFELTTDKLNATIAGSGSIKTTVKNQIKAKVVGSGSIYYKGKPKYIDTKSVGSGSVIDRN